MSQEGRELRVVHRKVAVKGSGGVSATVVIKVQQGYVWVSIEPPFTWEAIMDPGKVDEVIRTLAQAAEEAKQMAPGNKATVMGQARHDPSRPGVVG